MIRAPKLTTTIRLDGAFFEHDPAATFRDNVQAMMTALAIEGEIDAKARILSIPPAGVRTGATRRKIRGRARANAGKPWRVTAVIGIPNVGMTPGEAIATYAAMAAIERRYQPMRQTAGALRKAGAIARAKLTKGIG